MEHRRSPHVRSGAVDDRARDVCYANGPVVEGDRALMMSAATRAANANGPGKGA